MLRSIRPGKTANRLARLAGPGLLPMAAAGAAPDR
jgi:hypothetical protein